jgi:hypothetical protein
MEMIPFKAIAATSNPNQQDGAFTEDSLKSMEMEPVPQQYSLITHDFNGRLPIGKMLSSKYDNGKVIVTGRIKSSYKDKFGYIVPGGICKRGPDECIKEVIVNQFAFTKNPTDDSLTPIEYLEIDE